MKKIYFTIGALATLVSMTNAQSSFPPVDTSFANKEIIVPASPVVSVPVFIGGKDSVMLKDGKYAISKQWHDFIGYTPINPAAPSDSAYITINHEMQVKDNLIGDGGGMTVFKVRKKLNGSWEKYGPYKNIDFSEVGNTYANCGGITAPNGRIWTAEEWMTSSNKRMAGYMSDTSDWTIPGNAAFAGTTIKKYQNFNWMVEVDPAQAKAVKKMYNWGRFGHEGGVVMDDNKTVYLTDDHEEAAFYKFVANTPDDFSAGKLYAYQQSSDATSGTWVELMNSNLDSMIYLQDHALNKGATMFMRHEWITEINGKLYITETGSDSYSYKSALMNGRRLAKHLWGKDTATNPFITSNPKDSVIKDPYGRILVFDPATNNMSVFLEGGKAANYSVNKVHLSNPDGIGVLKVNGKTFLVIQEDLNGSTMGRVGNANLNGDKSLKRVCEMYLLDMSIGNPTLDDLKRFAITPVGAEVTGIAASPDGSVLFFNSQHPDPNFSTGDYKNSLTMMVTNLSQVVTSLMAGPNFSDDDSFQVWPNPASRELYMNVTTDVAIYDAGGKKVKVERGVDRLNISDLHKGVYFVQSIDGKVKKLVIE